MKLLSLAGRALAGGVLAALAFRRQRAEDPVDRLYGARNRSVEGLSGRLREGQSEYRDHLGARLDRNHHGQAAGRKGEPEGRRHHGGGRDQPGDFRTRKACWRRTRPPGLARLAPQYRDPKNPPAWVGMDVWGATICFNTAEAAKRNIPKPETWKDLTKPVYKGQIVMPHPASSGTGFFDVSAWLQIWGEEEGWKLHGRPAREHRAVHAFGFAPVRGGRSRRVRRRHLVRISRESREGARRADRTRVPEGRPGLGSGSDRRSSRARRTWLRRRSCWTGSCPTTRWRCMRTTSRSSRCRRCRSRCPMCRPTTRAGLVKNDFAWAAKNRDAFSRSGASATSQSRAQIGAAGQLAADYSPGSSARGVRPGVVVWDIDEHSDGAAEPAPRRHAQDRSATFVALKSIDLTSQPGELVCFLGPSGCGKTTLLRIIAGLEQQTSGRILQNGRDVSRAPPAARDYGIVFQSYALFPNLTIRDNVAYGLVNRAQVTRGHRGARAANC